MHTPLPTNPRLDLLQPYPFERLRALLATPAASRLDPATPLIDLSIGEPRHPTPPVVLDALAQAQQGLSSYPATAGKPALREAIGHWLERRYGTRLDPATQILPVNGSREALFAFAQAMLDPAERDAIVISPNPFYQIYEGAALLAGARLHLLDQHPDNGFRIDWQAVPEAVWQKTRLVYVCSPGNPTGKIMDLAEWKQLLGLADRWGFIIAADECYSEIYHDEASPPLGALEACKQLGRHDYRQIVVFSSLSKRSNVPGMRSG
ncbi:MAG: aminotransferase class I/II-fold pyridoxal phosphate-dependent enzyme, partial [Lautropia sp.]|nr:aminotransferase class I/II-fold pyridoxal phosphate-dependent enzyme [Lautropia sp.]